MHRFLKEENKRKKRIFTLAFLASLVYIFYRIFYTVPNNNVINIIFGIVVLSIEILELFFYAIYYFNVLLAKKSNPELPKINKKDYPEIDVLIATINEEKELLRETITKCKNMDYPDKKKIHIYVCDDGRRDEIKKLCDELRVNYIKRKDNKQAKAGNYNNALKKTSSPYVAVFDADMQPESDFLLETVPFLINDNNVGFVQTPQCFRNPDIYQLRYKMEGEMPHEQSYFFGNIQTAKNQVNSVIYCGTNTVFLRKALVEAGGFATESVTEDIATGIIIESLGYKAIGINKNKANGLNVNNLDSYMKQKSRWCRGCFQTFKNYKVFKNDGLNFRQKCDYASTLFYWTYGIRQIIYMIIPLLFTLFNIRFLRGNIILFLALFFIQYILKRFVVDIAEERKISSTWNRIYETILFPSIGLDLIKEYTGLGSKKFFVSPKNKEKNTMTFKNMYLLVSHLFFYALTIFGIALSIYKAINISFYAYIVTIFWLFSNLFYILFALIFDLSFKEIETNTKKTTDKYKVSNLFKIPFRFIKNEFKSFMVLILITLLIVFISYFSIKFHYKKEDNSIVLKNGWLSVKENILVNEKGEQITLRGVSSHHLYWFGYNYTYDNLKNIRDNWGVNVFRVALFTDPTDGGYISQPQTKKQLEDIVDICIELDMYVIIDWHILKDNDPRIYKDEAIEFFNEMSEKYKDVPNVIYEICNEPSGDDITWDEVIKPYAEELIDVIRNNSPKSIIIVGTANWSKDTVSVYNNPFDVDNIMYAVHVYQGEDFDSVSEYVDFAIENKIPIFITECAATDGSGDGKLYLDDFKDVIEYFEEHNISWIAWQLSDKPESSSILVEKGVRQKEWINSGKYSRKQIKEMPYDLNDYLTKEGTLIRDLIKKYSYNK